METKSMSAPVPKKIGKIAKMKKLLLEGSYSIEELVKESGANKTTAYIQLSSGFKKKGFNVIKEDGGGVLKYRIKK